MRELRSEEAREGDVIRLLEQGEYDEAVSEAVQQVIDLAGESFSFDQHVGTLRLMLYKLIAVDAFDGDPIPPAHAGSMIVKSIVATMQARREVEGENVDNIARALNVVLDELGEVSE